MKHDIKLIISAVGMCVALMAMTLQPNLLAADVDGDGLDDAWESANGYSVLLKTHIVHVVNLRVSRPAKTTSYYLNNKRNKLKSNVTIQKESTWQCSWL